MKKNNELLAKITCNPRDKKTISENLRQYGVCVIPHYISEESCDSTKSTCMEKISIEEDFNYEDGSYKRVNVKTDCLTPLADKRIYHIDCFSEEMLGFKRDKFIQEICESYYNNDSPHSVHVQIYERHNTPEIPVRGFHIDTFEASTFKAFLYLSDVGPKDGPTSFVLGTHKDKELRRLKQEVWGPARSEEYNKNYAPHPTNFLRSELGEQRLKNWVKILGKKGTLVLFDTWGVHCGTSSLLGGDRHVVVNYYRPGKDLPRSDFGFNSAKDFKKYHQQYIK